MEHMSDNTDYIAARGDYIYGKGVYHALCSLTLQKPRKLFNYCQGTQQRQMPMGMILCKPLLYLFHNSVRIYCAHILWNTCTYKQGAGIIISAWGSQVARSDSNGQFLRPQIVERATGTDSALFLFMSVTLILLLTTPNQRVYRCNIKINYEQTVDNFGTFFTLLTRYQRTKS